jgi:HlyD family secretion protein
MRRVTVSLVLSTCLFGTAVLSGCGAKEAFQQDQGAAVSVHTARATSGWISKGPVYTGTVQPSQQVQVVPKISGKIATIPVAVGSRVKAGDTLFTIDDRDYRTAVERAQAAVDAAQAAVQTAQTQQQSTLNQANSAAVQAQNGLIQAQNGVAQAQSNVQQLENALTMAKQALDDAATNKQRYEQLYAQNVVPKTQLEQAETAYVNAQANYQKTQEQLEAAKAALATAQQSVGTANAGYETAQKQVQVAQSTAGVEAAQKNLEQAKVNLKAAQDQLADATVTSPIDGIVGVKNADVGDMVSPSMPQPVVVVANLDTVKILVYVPASAINHLKVGDPVMVKAVALNQYFKGEVKHISPLDEKGKGYPVEVSVPNKDLRLKSGMVTEVNLLGPDAKQGIVVPTAGVVQENGKAYVYVSENNQARRKEVTIAQQEGSQTLVTSGLKDGDVVIVDQLPLLKDGAKISVQQDSSSSAS